MADRHPLAAPIREAGFELFGVLPAGPSQSMPRFAEWLTAGRHGTMEWMAKPAGVARRADPREILPSVQSIVVLAFRYTPDPIPDDLLNDPSRGIIARYALYDDYHTIIPKKLNQVAAAIEQQFGGGEWRAYTDTGPFLEREWARRAGLGFVGRNSNLIHYQLGSYLFLAEILMSVRLPEYSRLQPGSCGNCRQCVGDCPTGAILENNTIDARRCISYLTIEHRGPIPEWVRPLMKNRIYGCDICQEVCPWNRKPTAQAKADFRVRSDLVAPPLRDLLYFDDESFRERFRRSPIRRAKREGFMRNVAVALGNWGSPEARDLLTGILRHDPSALVREHADWALAKSR